MIYADTLQLIAHLPARQPAPALPSRLGILFHRLALSPDAGTATEAEEQIWDAWMYHTHEGAERALDLAVRDMAAQRWDLAETRLTQLLRRRPDYAEAWNKRATLYYMLERDDESVRDMHRALELEPRHFAAICSFAEILNANGELGAADFAFSTALRIHPHLPGVRDTLAELRRPPLPPAVRPA